MVLRAGRNLEPGRYDEVLINEPFAQAHGLEPGDHLPAVINGKLRSLLIVGHALSPEYVFAVDSGLLMPDDARFTPMWMLEDAIEAAVEGQSPALSPSQLARRGDQLQRKLRDVDTIVEAASIIAKLNANHTSDRNA